MGAWQLVSRLGQGSVADVYAARPIHAGTQDTCDYAVKVLRRSLRDEPLAQASLRNEARAGRAISNPHVVPIFQSPTIDAGGHEAAADSSVDGTKVQFLVMPRLVGATLDRAKSRIGRMPIPHALWMARQVCEGLTAAHHDGWIHGDVKPANVHVSMDGHATLIDLGCAHRADSADADTKLLLNGTIDYVAPERLTSRHQSTSASDVYSLGISLFEMLTGRLPFNANRPARMAEAHLREIPPSPRTFVPQIPRPVAQLLQRMLAKDTARRPHVAEELPAALRRLEIETFDLRSWTEK